ncbi:MAG: deoxyribose-phosphate aldolase [Clostridiales bacterium]|nr:deoxyribose-phosphate aldolase [Lachnospiraceae bacterium]MCD8323635.1 deoxyribose-phosphate aldolase [Clostridiales bacterium]MCD8333672.1 deoxyribose-phosphate aldolase [Clostridiales bacterium]
MRKEELYRYVEHTALNAWTSWNDIKNLCNEAIIFRMAAVCIPSSYVKRVRDTFPGLNICTVVGFPLGNANTAAKVAEAGQAIRDGANEIDMVINLGKVKNSKFADVTEEIRLVKETIGEHILKVIIETCYLNEEEKIALCRCVSEAGADFIKTSTGFGCGGATLDDVNLLREHIAPQVQIKAAGGISTREEMEQYIAAGCSRIGTSRAIRILS